MAKRVSYSPYQYVVWKMLFVRGSQSQYAMPTRRELLTTCSELQRDYLPMANTLGASHDVFCIAAQMCIYVTWLQCLRWILLMQ